MFAGHSMLCPYEKPRWAFARAALAIEERFLDSVSRAHTPRERENARYSARNDAAFSSAAARRRRQAAAPVRLFFADEVAAAARAHACGVGGSGGDVAALSYRVGMGFSIHGQRHFAIENDVGGEAGVGVVGIERVGTILPDESVQEAFGFELLLHPAFV